MLDEDLGAFLEDHGVPCRCGTTDFLGIKDEPDEDVGLGMTTAQSSMTTLRVLTSVVVAAGIQAGAIVTVNGVAMKARNPAREDDGVFSLVPLYKDSP